MEHDDAPNPDTPAPTPFLRSRGGAVLIAFLVIAGLLLGYEHRAHVLSGDGLLIGLLVTCIAMHLFMHHGHGGHGGRGGGGNADGGGRS